MGSKSGFDSLDECFDDLTPHIFAVETGLSSDPPMNWRVPCLDGLTLVSNSDAHSPLNLGREANLLDTALEYSSIKSAIKSGDPKRFLGTFEFYPEEGKYHLDGHRNCDICLHPKNSMAQNGICPVCGKPLTLGVLYRVEELANRPDGVKPETAPAFYSIVPLAEILSEIFKVGPKSKKVQHSYMSVLEALGPEFEILHNLSADEIDKAGVPLLGEAVKRIRQKKVHISPGYDGEYGKVTVFTPQEREELLGQRSLFTIPSSPEKKRKKNPAKTKIISKDIKKSRLKAYEKKPDTFKDTDNDADILHNLNNEQRKAVQSGNGPLLIVAGPGTGKTRTLTHKIAYMITEKKALPENILAVTFTNKAVQEMSSRLKSLLNGLTPLPFVATFHSLCYKILKDQNNNNSYTIIDDNDRKYLISDAVKYIKQKGVSVSIKPDTLLNMIISAKQQILGPGDDLNAVGGCNSELLSLAYKTYQKFLSMQSLFDYEDLIFNVVKRLETENKFCGRYRDKFKHIFVDEYQDINQGQYRIIRALAAPEEKGRGLCVIGDPNQSIYGFRGSDVQYFNKFIANYPEAKVIKLTRNYRSARAILEASYQIISGPIISNPIISDPVVSKQVIKDNNDSKSRIYSEIDGVKTISILESATEKAEAVSIGKTIENLIGGIGFHSIDFGKTRNSDHTGLYGFSDFAVLYRTNSQGEIIADFLEKAGIPCQMASRENIFCRKGIQEIISLLKTTSGHGSCIDFEKLADLKGSGIDKKTLDIFNASCFDKNLAPKEGMINIRDLPLQNISIKRRSKLIDFAGNLLRLEKDTKNMTVENRLLYLLENTGMSEAVKSDPETKDVFLNLIDISTKFGADTADFFESFALQTDTDLYDSQSEKVSLMTMHTAKGLEFPVVFIAGCEKDYIPFKKSENENADIDEERRLFYVAMTRAKEKLFFTYAKKRRIYGKNIDRSLSPFVGDIEKSLKKHETSGFKRIKENAPIQLGLF